MYKIKTHISLNGETIIYIIREDGANIPTDETNRDYREYLAWIDNGNTPEIWTSEEVE